MKVKKYLRGKIRQRAMFGLVLVLTVTAAFVWQTAKMMKAQGTNDSIVFDDFAAWTRRHLNSDYSEAEKHLETGEKLAIRRRQQLEDLIRNDPAAASLQVVSPEIADKLPDSIRQHLEKYFSSEGDFIVQVFDRIDAATGEMIDHRTEREIVLGDNRYRAFVYGRKEAMTTKLNVPLSGHVLGDAALIAENSVRELASSSPENGVKTEVGGKIVNFKNQKDFNDYVGNLNNWETKIAPIRSAAENQISPWTEGSKKVLYIRVDFPDRPGEPLDAQNAPLTIERAKSVFTDAVNPFYVSNSYNKTNLQATVTPIVRMPQPQSFYTGANMFALYSDARAAARAAGFETDDYNFDLIAFGFSQNYEFSGTAMVGGKGLLLNGYFDFKVTAHELGHNYGLRHANLWRTTDGTVIGAGGNQEYGDGFDMMGGGASQRTHFNAGYKRALDWLTEANVRTVTEAGTYRIFAHDSSANPTSVQLLKIKKDPTKNYLLEFRQLITSAPALLDGAVLRWDFLSVDGVRRQTQLLDMAPTTATIADAPIVIGQTFADNATGIRVTPLGKGGTVPESLDVRVEFNYSLLKGAPFDFDGDHKTDVAVFRPGNGVWYLNRSNAGFQAFYWGMATDKIVPAKFNADRMTDAAVYRDGTWYVYNSFGGNPVVVQFGTAEDIPVPADYDGDGFAEMAVYRPSNGVWYMWNWVFQRFSAVQFGISSDKPVPADYDGDGKTDVAVYRPENGIWYLLQSSQGFKAVQFGLSEDKPVIGDYDGDGKADAAVFRPSNGVWYLLQSLSGFSATQFGIATDTPAPGDYDGDGKTDISVFRDGFWYRINSANNQFQAVHFGQSNDRPVQAGNLNF